MLTTTAARIDWHISEDDQVEDSQGLLEKEWKEGGATPNYPPQRSRFYELAVVFVLIYSLVGFWSWQHIQNRMAELEDELISLRTELSLQEEQDSVRMISIEKDKILPPQMMETTYFTLIFSETNMDVVTSVASILDKQYMELHRQLGLKIMSGPAQVTIYINSPHVQAPSDQQYDVVVNLAEYTKVGPRGTTQTEWLRQKIAIQLFKRTLNEASSSRN